MMVGSARSASENEQAVVDPCCRAVVEAMRHLPDHLDEAPAGIHLLDGRDGGVGFVQASRQVHGSAGRRPHLTLYARRELEGSSPEMQDGRSG